MVNFIRGYKLKLPKYKEASEAIMGRKFNNVDLTIDSDSHAIIKLYEANVLKIWFDPIEVNVTLHPDTKMVPHLFVNDHTWVIRKDQKDTIMFHQSDGRAWGLHNNEWINVNNYQPFYTKGIFILASREEVASMYLEMIKRLEYVEGCYIVRNKRPCKLLKIGKPSVAHASLRIKIEFDKRPVWINAMKHGIWLAKSHIEDNTWYYHTEKDDYLIYHKTGNIGYGIWRDGNWVSEEMFKSGKIIFPLMGFESEKFEIAPKRKVVAELVNYGIANGYFGDNVVDTQTLQNWTFSYDEKKNSLEVEWEDFNDKITKRTIMENGVWVKPPLTELPYIKGMKGEYNEVNREVVYNNCAALSIDWFSPSFNRTIQSMVLSSGVAIHKKEMEQIRQYLKEREII